jgi:hypothetical protein
MILFIVMNCTNSGKRNRYQLDFWSPEMVYMQLINTEIQYLVVTWLIFVVYVEHTGSINFKDPL